MSQYRLKSRRSYADDYKRYLPTIVAVAIGLTVAIVFLGYMIRKKTPVSFETVWETVEKHGFNPIDTTENNKTVSNGIEKCLSFKSDDVNFIFFTAVDTKHAINIYVDSLIPEIKRLTNYHDSYKTRRGEYNSNYANMPLSGEGKWGIAYYVGNTGGIAWCDEENAGVLTSILREMKYID